MIKDLLHSKHDITVKFKDKTLDLFYIYCADPIQTASTATNWKISDVIVKVIVK